MLCNYVVSRSIRKQNKTTTKARKQRTSSFVQFLDKVGAHGGRDFYRYTGKNKTPRLAEFVGENCCHFEKNKTKFFNIQNKILTLKKKQKAKIFIILEKSLLSVE